MIGPQSHAPRGTPLPRAAHLTLLVVRDSEQGREIAEAGRQMGLAVYEAGSPEEGLAAWREGTGIVFIGASFAGEAKPLLEKAVVSGAQVRAVGDAERGDEILRLLKAGATGYLPLPQPPPGLAAEIRRVLAYEEERRYEDTGIGRAKAQLQAVFDTFPSPLLVLARDMRIRRANRAALTLSGRVSAADLAGASACDVYRETLGGEDSPVARAVGANRHLDHELTVAADAEADGPRRVYHCRVFPGEADSKGLSDGALVLLEDVTHRRREEVEHAHAQRLEAVALLAATLSHEVNQPLGAIMGRGQLALMNLDQPSPDVTLLRRDIEEIVECVHRVTAILDKLHRVTDIVTKPYLGETEILDLERSAGPGKEEPH